MDDRPDKIGAKIRLSELNKVPIMLIVGEKEEDNSTVTVRRRFVKDQETINLDSLINVVDVVLLVNYILGIDSLSEDSIQQADLDNNNSINIVDVVALINLILS